VIKRWKPFGDYYRSSPEYAKDEPIEYGSDDEELVLLSDYQKLESALNGMIGLVQLLSHNQDVPPDIRADMLESHRFKDAQACFAAQRSDAKKVDRRIAELDALAAEYGQSEIEWQDYTTQLEAKVAQLETALRRVRHAVEVHVVGEDRALLLELIDQDCPEETKGGK
jgi:hypothetical protein